MTLKHGSQNRVLRGTNRVIDTLVDGSGFLAIAIMIALSVFVTVVMLSRHLAAFNIPGFFDASTYALIVFPFVSAAFSLRAKKHIIIDVVCERLSPKGQALLDIVTGLFSLAITAILVKEVSKWFGSLYSRKVLTVAVWQIPMWVLVGLILLGSALLFIQVFRNLCGSVKTAIADKSSFYAKDIITVGVVIACCCASVYLYTAGKMYLATLLICLVLLFSGMPVFLALLGMGIVGLFFSVGAKGLLQVPITIFGELNSFELTCLPLFIFAGCVMGRGNLIDDLFNFVEAWIGGFTPSLLIVTVIVGALISALTGSSTAATAMLAATAIPQMEKRGFKKSLSCGIIAAAGTGSLIPPSTGYVVYSILTDNSIGKMFIGAYLPALLMFALFIGMIILMNIFNKASFFEGGVIRHRPESERKTFRQKLLLTWKAFPTLLGPILMFYTLYKGIFTPTEAAAFLLVYSIFVTLLVKRTLTLRQLYESCKEGAYTSSLILCILATAFIFANVISQLGVAELIMDFTQKVGFGKVGVLLSLFFVLLVLGMFMPPAASTIITIPIFYPIAVAVGINPLFLGAFIQINVEFASFTPPFGMDFFVLKAVANSSFGEVVKGVLPFALVYLVTLALISFFPEIVTWLPSLMA